MSNVDLAALDNGTVRAANIASLVFLSRKLQYSNRLRVHISDVPVRGSNGVSKCRDVAGLLGFMHPLIPWSTFSSQIASLHGDARYLECWVHILDRDFVLDRPHLHKNKFMSFILRLG
jgi:hypothetical protein